MRKIMTLFAPLLLLACADKQAIVTIPLARCANLVPATWRDGVDAAPVPDMPTPTKDALADALAANKAWATGYVAMSAQLEKANGRTADAIDIFANCEAMVNDARPKR